MAVAFDAKATTVTAQGAPSSPITNTTLTTGGSASIVFGVFSAVTDTTLAVATSMTWNGVTMTLVGSQIASDSKSSVYVYAIVNPATGNQTLSCAFTNGSGSQQVDLDCFSFTGTATASVAAAIPSANIISDASTPAGTVYPASAMTVTTANGDAAVAVANSVSTVLNGANVGTLINAEHASLVNYVSIYNLAVGSSTQVQFTDNGINGFPCEALAFDVAQPTSTSIGWFASFIDPIKRKIIYQPPLFAFTAVVPAQPGPATSGGAISDAGTTFNYGLTYRYIAQPVVFTAATTPTGWNDPLEIPVRNWQRSSIYSAPYLAYVEVPPFPEVVSEDRWHQPWSGPVWSRTAQQQQSLAFLDPTQPAPWTQWTDWPDFAPGKPRTPPHQPWGFVPPPAQVFFPYAPWDDFTRRKPQPLDTQPLAWPSTPVATPFPAMGWTNWPDFAPRAKRTADFISWTFIPPAAQVWFPYGPWDDFTRRRPQYPDTQPLAWTGQNIAAPVPTMAWVQWPDFAPRPRTRVDTQPAVFVPIVTAATVAWNAWTSWPDLVLPRKSPTDLTPWKFVPYQTGTVVFDAVSTATPIVNAAGPLTWTHTPVGTPTAVAILLDAWASSLPTPTSVTYGGVTCTLAASTTNVDNTFIYGLANPPAGPQTVVVNYTGTAYWVGFAVTVTGSDTSTVFSNTASGIGNSASISSTCASHVNELVIDIASQDPNTGNTQTAGAGQTDRGQSTSSDLTAGVSTEPGAFPNVTMSWTINSTATTWNSVSASFKAGPLIPTPWTAWTQWPDLLLRQRRLVDTQLGALVFNPPAPPVVISPWPSFEDFARWPRRPLNFDALAFVQPVPQIWYPAAPWPDYIVRKKQPLDTQPTAFVQIVTPQATFIVTANWPDFVWAKKRPLNYDPLTLVQTVRTPWNNMAQWPDFAPIRGKSGLHAALQQFSAKYPGIISQATVTGIMAAFETNSDTAKFAIYVIRGGPAVSASVSLRELPIIGSATSVEEI